MIEERYCSKEVAKLLKEKGFDEPCQHFYKFDSNEIYRGTVFTNTQIGDKFYIAPTHQMACDWLREVHNIFIVVEPHMYDYINEKNSSYVISLWQGDNYYENITSKDYPTYEEAVEASLKYSLTELMKGDER